MRGNRGKDTKPELTVRRLLTKLGYRYRLHASDLPGRPDIVFRARCKVILVQGCFWHQHDSVDCRLRSHPRANPGYWGPKLARNRARDKEVQARLAQDGWKAMLVWECEIAGIDALIVRLRQFLGETRLRSTSQP